MSLEDEVVAIHIFLMSSVENWYDATELDLVLLRVSFARMQKSARSVNVATELEFVVISFCKKVYHFGGLLILRCDAYNSTIF